MKKLERQELEGLETTSDGTLVIRRVGRLSHGSRFSRVTQPSNYDCPEYILGQMAIKAGYTPRDEVKYELRIKKHG